MTKTQIPSEAEPQFIDLSNPQHRANPLIRLHGIINDCAFLADAYPEKARGLWKCQDEMNACRRAIRTANPPQAEGEFDVARAANELLGCYKIEARGHRDFCDKCSEKLRVLLKAANPMMPATAAQFKFLAFHTMNLHAQRDIDWAAMVDDLKAISAQAHLLIDKPDLLPGGKGNWFGSGKANKRKMTGERVLNKRLTLKQKTAADTLSETSGNKTEAAKRLGISRKALDDRLRGITLRSEFSPSRSVKAKRLPSDNRGQPSV